jgi:hypothetical protein
MGRRSAIPPKYDPSIVELDGDLRRGEIIELLQGLRFIWDDETHALTIDKDIRDLFLDALRVKR